MRFPAAMLRNMAVAVTLSGVGGFVLAGGSVAPRGARAPAFAVGCHEPEPVVPARVTVEPSPEGVCR